MGQIKRLLDDLLLEETYLFPDDLHMDYEIWVLQKEAEKSAYEELLADIK
jgi:hypothetical protein